MPISPSTYYEWIAKAPTCRQVRDAELVEIITAAREDKEDKKAGKFVATLGSRKLWIWLRGRGHDVARCTVERIFGRKRLGGCAVRLQTQNHRGRRLSSEIPGSGRPCVSG